MTARRAPASYLCNRRQCVRVDESRSDYITTIHGVPQGEISSMLLFLINVDDVPFQIPNASLAALFIDDLSGVWSSHDINSLQTSIVSDFSSL